MHQQLPVRAEHVDQADVTGLERAAFLTRQLIPIEEPRQIGSMLFLDGRVAIDVVQEFLQLIQANDEFAPRAAADQAPQCGM